MKVALLNTKNTPRSDYILQCFAAGLVVHGDEVLWIKDQNDASLLDQADVGVQVCFPNRNHDGNDLAIFRLESYRQLIKAGKRVLTIDTGFVRSQPEVELAGLTGTVGKPIIKAGAFRVDRADTYPAADHTVYYAAGFDGIKRQADYGCKDVPGDRWDRLKTKVYPWRPMGKHIVMIGQPLHGQSSQHTDIRVWYGKVVSAIREQTKRVIIYRPHPRIASFRTSPIRQKRDELGVRQAVGRHSIVYSKNRLLKDDLHMAHAVVAFTSNAVVEAIIRGIPVIACDPTCMAWDVAEHKLSNIEKPSMPERTTWLHRLAYAQWNCAELREGRCWKHLRPHASKS